MTNKPKGICQALIRLVILGIFLLAQGCASSPFEAFVVSKESKKLTVLNYDDDKDRLDVENSPFDIGEEPVDIAYDQRHKRVYVVNSGENSVSVFKMKLISESTFERRYILQELDKLSTKEEPVAVDVDTGNNLVLILHKDGTLMRFNGKDLSLSGEKNILRELIFTPEATDLTYDARHDLIYVLDRDLGAMLVFESTDLKPVNFIKTPANPCSLAYDYVNDRVYVTTLGGYPSEEPTGLSIYRAGPHCYQVRDPISFDMVFRCPIVTYDDVHNLIYIGKGRTFVYDAESFELIDEMQTSLPYSLATGRIDSSQSILLYVGMPGSVGVYEILAGDNHVYLDQVTLPGPADYMAAVSPACPEIISVEPQSGKVGEAVTILGLNFGEQKGRSIVEFGGSPVTEEDVISWSDTNIQVKVPEMVKSGEIRVIVGNSSTVLSDDQSVEEFEVIPGRIIHVSANEGYNSGDGTEGSPYKTITRALSQAEPSDVIYVHGGTYDRELGERFPLEVGDGVRVEGYGAGYDSPPYHFKIIYSSPGDSAVELGEGASIYNMGVYVDENSPDDGAQAIGIHSYKTSHIEEMVVAGFRTGVSLDGGMHGEISPSVKDSHISACEIGIEVRGNNTNAEIVHNNIFQNTIAIDMLSNANRVISNDIWENVDMGVKIQGKVAFISSNFVRLTHDPEENSIGTGISGGGMTHTFIIGNLIYNNDEGSFTIVQPGYHHFIRSNLVQNNMRDGIRVAGDGFCVLELNDIRENLEAGVYLSVENSRLQNNSISYNNEGIRIYSMTKLDTLLVDNRFYGNTIAGLSITGNFQDPDENVTVRVGETDGIGNTISNNRKGISISNAWASVFNNTIEGNDWGVFASENGIINLGSVGSPGMNTIRNSTHVGLANHSNRTIRAAGNTWNPSTQGSDNEGHYSTGIVEGPVESQDGNNYSINSQYGKIEF
jgi:parallel beta-helix repeat protein